MFHSNFVMCFSLINIFKSWGILCPPAWGVSVWQPGQPLPATRQLRAGPSGLVFNFFCPSIICLGPLFNFVIRPSSIIPATLCWWQYIRPSFSLYLQFSMFHVIQAMLICCSSPLLPYVTRLKTGSGVNQARNIMFHWASSEFL